MVFTHISRSVAHTCKLLAATLVFLSTLLVSSLASAEYRLNLQDPVTQVARDIYSLHMLIFWVCVAIFVLVFGVMFYSIFKHRKSKNVTPATFSHSTSVEIVWTVIPFIILVVMAWPATKVLIKMEDTTKSDLTIKITGYQWKWSYEYPEAGIQFYSTLATPRQQIDQFDKATAEQQGENYLLEVDNHLIVPSGRKVRALITANDVIHAWWIPAFGTKKDAIPGYINELWFNVDEGKEGLYRGQCAELCGKDHAYMPIVVEVVTGEQFDNWIATGGKQLTDQAGSSSDSAAAAPAQAAVAEQSDAANQDEEKQEAVFSKTWTKESLMAKGEEVYANCSACHGADGKGLPGVFPAIAGNPMVTGDVEEHISVVMHGRPGTAMTAYAGQLSDEDIAAVVTYQRNAFGNDVGDVVLPSDIKAKR